MTTTKHPEFEVGSGNVFADIGVANAEGHFLKAQIVTEIHKAIKARKLSQAKAGAMIGITQPEVSRMLRGHFREYSVERLMRFLTAFDRDVDIVIRRRDSTGERGEVRVSLG